MRRIIFVYTGPAFDWYLHLVRCEARIRSVPFRSHFADNNVMTSLGTARLECICSYHLIVIFEWQNHYTLPYSQAINSIKFVCSWNRNLICQTDGKLRAVYYWGIFSWIKNLQSLPFLYLENHANIFQTEESHFNLSGHKRLRANCVLWRVEYHIIYINNVRDQVCDVFLF